MTWNEYLEMLMKQGSSFDLAMNVVGRLMDLYESYEWDDIVPFEV